MKSISLYVDNGMWLTRLHPFTKLWYVAVAVAAAPLSGNLLIFGCFIALSLLLLACNRILKKTLPLIAFSFTILLTIFLIHGLFNRANSLILFRLGPLKFYREGLLYALRIGLNILNMLMSFAVFVLSTKPGDLVEALEQKGCSPRLGYIVISVFQIIPQMTGTMSTITDAQRSRGMETEGSLLTRAKAFIPLISPAVMSSLINTRERAIALEVRGFDSDVKKTYLTQRRMSARDKAVCAALGLLLMAAAAWRVSLCLT